MITSRRLLFEEIRTPAALSTAFEFTYQRPSSRFPRPHPCHHLGWGHGDSPARGMAALTLLGRMEKGSKRSCS